MTYGLFVFCVFYRRTERMLTYLEMQLGVMHSRPWRDGADPAMVPIIEQQLKHSPIGRS